MRQTRKVKELVDEFLDELYYQLSRKVSKKETEEAVIYYEEMIYERYENGEGIYVILDSYNINQIIRIYEEKELKSDYKKNYEERKSAYQNSNKRNSDFSRVAKTIVFSPAIFLAVIANICLLTLVIAFYIVAFAVVIAGLGFAGLVIYEYLIGLTPFFIGLCWIGIALVVTPVLFFITILIIKIIKAMKKGIKNYLKTFSNNKQKRVEA